MTDLNSLTLAEIEALAERLGNAAKTIRDAQSLLGGAPSVAPAPVAPQPVRAQVVQRGVPNPLLDAGENAERARLLQQFKPEDVEAMERP